MGAQPARARPRPPRPRLVYDVCVCVCLVQWYVVYKHLDGGRGAPRAGGAVWWSQIGEIRTAVLLSRLWSAFEALLAPGSLWPGAVSITYYILHIAATRTPAALSALRSPTCTFGGLLILFLQQPPTSSDPHP
jgi:hypothetical protein